MKASSSIMSGIDYYLVGGAVRDRLLGLEVHECDWVVVGATPNTLIERGFTPVGRDFPVFLHPDTKEEYALARTERKTGHGYGGFTFHTDTNITLEEDLARRDLTINAIAEDSQGKLIDPFNGRRDLDHKRLKHVSPAFAEDPLRVLRVARFAARFHRLGFRIAPATLTLMRALSDNGELEHLVTERIWKETSRALMEADPQIFFRTLDDCGALPVLFPEIAALKGVPQPATHHPEIDTFKHLCLCLKQTSIQKAPLTVRYAVLCHDLGKGETPNDILPHHYGHEARGIPLTKRMGQRLTIPKALTELALLTCEFHTHCHRAFELKPATLQKLFKSLDSIRRPQRLANFLAACTADARGREGYANSPYPQADFLAAIADKMIVDSKPLQAQGFTGKSLGEAIRQQQIRQLREARQTWLEQH